MNILATQPLIIQRLDQLDQSGQGAELLRRGEDAVIVEGPLQVLLNGEQLAVTMRTPGDDEMLAWGLAVGEGFIKATAAVRHKRHGCHKLDDAGIVDLVVDEEDCLAPPRARNQVSSASCGLCGCNPFRTSKSPRRWLIRQMLLKAFMPVECQLGLAAWSRRKMPSGARGAAMRLRLPAMAACCTLPKTLGRHNAVDKVIGMALAQGQLALVQSLVVSGRVSFEIVSKAARAGIPCLAAVSAPSTLAVRTAERCGICLLGFCRGPRFTVYSHGERLSFEGALDHV